MSREVRSYFTAGGDPVCGRGCRWPRGRCPTHRTKEHAGPGVSFVSQASQTVTVVRNGVPQSAATDHNAYVPDTVCGECGYFVHAPTCPTQRVKFQGTSTGRFRVDVPNISAEPRGGFAVGDLVRCYRLMKGGGPEYSYDPGFETAGCTVGKVYRVTEVPTDTTIHFRDDRGHVANWTTARFERVPADELPPGWRLLPGGTHYEYEDRQRAWKLDAGGYTYNTHSLGVRGETVTSLHDAMRLARGLDRVEQLWDANPVPTLATARGGVGSSVGRPGADAPRAPAAAVAGTSGKSTSGGAPLGQVAPSLRPQNLPDPEFLVPNHVLASRAGKSYAMRIRMVERLVAEGYIPKADAAFLLEGLRGRS